MYSNAVLQQNKTELYLDNCLNRLNQHRALFSKYINGPWKTHEISDIKSNINGYNEFINNLYVKNTDKRFAQVQPDSVFQLIAELTNWIIHYIDLPFAIDLFDSLITMSNEFILKNLTFVHNKDYLWKQCKYPDKYVNLIICLQNSIPMLFYSMERLLKLNVSNTLLILLNYIQNISAVMTFPQFSTTYNRLELFSMSIQIFIDLLNHISGLKNFKDIVANRVVYNKQLYKQGLNCLYIWILMLKFDQTSLQNIVPGLSSFFTVQLQESQLFKLSGFNGVIKTLKVIHLLSSMLFNPDKQKTISKIQLIHAILNKNRTCNEENTHFKEFLKRLDIIYQKTLPFALQNTQIIANLKNISLNVLTHYPVEYLQTEHMQLCNTIFELLITDTKNHQMLHKILPKYILENLMQQVLNSLDAENLAFQTTTNITAKFNVLIPMVVFYCKYYTDSVSNQFLSSLSNLYSIDYRKLCINTQNAQLTPLTCLMNYNSIDEFMLTDVIYSIPTGLLRDSARTNDLFDSSYLKNSVLLLSYDSNSLECLNKLCRTLLKCYGFSALFEVLTELLDQCDSQQQTFDLITFTGFCVESMESNSLNFTEIQTIDKVLMDFSALKIKDGFYVKLLCIHGMLKYLLKPKLKECVNSMEDTSIKKLDLTLRKLVFYVLYEGYKTPNNILKRCANATFSILASCYSELPNTKFENLISQTIDKVAYNLYSVNVQTLDITNYYILFTVLSMTTSSNTILCLTDINKHLISHLRTYSALQHMSDFKRYEKEFLWCIKLLAIIASKLMEIVYAEQLKTKNAIERSEKTSDASLFNMVELQSIYPSLLDMAESIFQESRRLMTNTNKCITFNAHIACLYSFYCFTVTRKTYLPKIHQIWPTLVYSFKTNQGDTTNLVATITLKLIINISPRFIMPRFEIHLLPFFLSTLKNPCNNDSETKTPFLFRNQLYLLSLLITVLKNLKLEEVEISEKSLAQVFGTTIFFFHSQVHSSLQVNAFKLFHQLIIYNSYFTKSKLAALLFIFIKFDKKNETFEKFIKDHSNISSLSEAIKILENTGITTNKFIKPVNNKPTNELILELETRSHTLIEQYHHNFIRIIDEYF